MVKTNPADMMLDVIKVIIIAIVGFIIIKALLTAI